jgi:tetratricopeptide (TPR) repeat protein
MIPIQVDEKGRQRKEAATMSDVVCLVSHLIERAHRLAQSSQYTAAIELLHDVASFPLSSRRSEEVERLLGELYFKQRRFRKAARHLRRAIGLAPHTARYHYLLGLCVATHPRGRRERALAHFRRALKLAPTHRRCRAEAGLLAVRMGKIGLGLRWLRQSAQGEPRLVAKLARGYCEAGQPEKAKRAVQLARFAAPRCPRLRQFQAQLQLGRLRGQQANQAAKRASTPVVLPFLFLRHVD